jgi:CO/xanthine dehydrogenase Mo-binding subunit
MTDLSQSPIGQSIRRREDERFLTGNGQYTDDVVLPGQTYGVFLRSPHAHARIRSINTQAALAMPGVVAIFTGKDIADSKIGGLPCGWLIHSRDGSPMKEPPHPIIAADKALHVGDQVALIVAETALQAKDAAEAVEVGYEALPAVADVRAAVTPGVSALHDEAPDNSSPHPQHHPAPRSHLPAALAPSPRRNAQGLLHSKPIHHTLREDTLIFAPMRTNRLTLQTSLVSFNRALAVPPDTLRRG